MKLIFWLSFATVGYAYFGYAILLAVYASLSRKPYFAAPMTPTVSILIAAHNEESRLPARLANLNSLQYPPEQVQVIVASDGSTDRTVDILREYAPGVTLVILEKAMGKASALNEAVDFATGEIFMFLDVRQTIEQNALAELVSCFADPQVGAVSGELLLETDSGASSEDALGIYWKIEKAVRKLESATGSVVGVTGAIYAIRRELYVKMPAGTILDDVFVPMNVARMGKRVIFQPSAIARDRIFSEPGKEFARKVRTLTGNYQLVRLAPWLLSPANPLLFRFISHKLLRLVVPLFLIVMLVASAMVGGGFYRTIFVLQLLFYVAALFGTLSPSTQKFKPVAIANTFVMLNLAAAIAFYNFVARREKVWV
jgi:poly-beta-1,6-N-acetyl-D-glucosamine synthase